MSELSRELRAGLRQAFIDESMTAQRYAYFAQVAEIEGHLDVAAIFSELAEGSVCAAHGHLDFLQHIADPVTDLPLGATRLNLAAAVAGALGEAGTLYPRLATAAHDDGVADVASWLETLSALKRAHAMRLEQALTALAEFHPGED